MPYFVVNLAVISPFIKPALSQKCSVCISRYTWGRGRGTSMWNACWKVDIPVVDLGKGPRSPLILGKKKEEMAEGRKASRSSESKLPPTPPPLSSRSGSAPVFTVFRGWADMEENCEERKTEDGFCHLNRGNVPNLSHRIPPTMR